MMMMNGPHAIAASMFNGYTHPLDTLAALLAREASEQGLDPSEAAELFAREAAELIRLAMDKHERIVFNV